MQARGRGKGSVLPKLAYKSRLEEVSSYVVKMAELGNRSCDVSGLPSPPRPSCQDVTSRRTRDIELGGKRFSCACCSFLHLLQKAAETSSPSHDRLGDAYLLACVLISQLLAGLPAEWVNAKLARFPFVASPYGTNIASPRICPVSVDPNTR